MESALKAVLVAEFSFCHLNDEYFCIIINKERCVKEKRSYIPESSEDWIAKSVMKKESLKFKDKKILFHTWKKLSSV